MSIRYFLRSGAECDDVEFHRRYADRSYRQIACDAVDDKTVSTVWLGCNLEALPGSPDVDLVFGTCVLPDGDETRYRTEAEALEGHKRVVDRLKEVASASS